MTAVDFQSNLRKQIRKLPKFLKFVKIIQFYSIVSLAVTADHPLHEVRLPADGGDPARHADVVELAEEEHAVVPREINRCTIARQSRICERSTSRS